jgi:hypothetical protein
MEAKFYWKGCATKIKFESMEEDAEKITLLKVKGRGGLFEVGPSGSKVVIYKVSDFRGYALK